MTRLLPGAHLYPTADAWRCSLPGDRFIRLSGPAELLHRFQGQAHGETVLPVGEAEAESLRQLEQLFAEQDLIVAPGPDVPPSRRRPRILLSGDNPIAEAVRELLAPWAEVTTNSVDEGAIAQSDLLISCAGWLPDTRWLRVGDWCRAHGTAWHRSHAEGTSLFLGPFSVPGATPDYRDVRGRRLAASGVPDELLAFWRYLDQDDVPHPPVPWPGPGAIAVAAGLLVDDVHRWWHGGVPDPVSYQQELLPAPLRIVPHPVLALPLTENVDRGPDPSGAVA